MQLAQENLPLCGPPFSLNTHQNCRSIAIDHLNNLFHQGQEKVKLVYVYFDYKAQQTQTLTNVVESLLKQLVSQLETVPPELDALYEESIRKITRPETSKLSETLLSLLKGFCTFAVFDALDECSEKHQAKILSLFSDLQKSACRLLVSSRPHIQCLEKLTDRLTFSVVADESDLRNYIIFRLKKERNKNEVLEARCLQLSKGAEGMYVSKS